MNMSPIPIEKEIVRFAGDLAESLSLNKSLGQIYGLLYILPEPLSLEEIARRLSMSKGNASVNLRVLESWSAVQSVSVSGSRRDHYRANTDLKGIALRRLQEGVLRRLDMTDERLNELTGRLRSGGRDLRLFQERIKGVRSLSSSLRRLLGLLPKAAFLVK